jgi:DNA-binding XRE family transcriptional regulator
MASPTERSAAVTDDVKFIRGNDRINRLSERPDLAPGVKQVREAMETADRVYAMGLATLRQAAELTQVELAKKLGVTQAAVSRMEQPHDMLLSTLNAYLEAVGGHAKMIVRFDNGQEVELDLPRLK